MKRQEIDKALLENTLYRHIASQYGTSTTALQRHKANDLPRALIQSRQAEEVVHNSNPVTEMLHLNSRTETILTKAERRGDLKIALSAIGEVRKNKELLARFQGELEKQSARVTTYVNGEMTNQMASVPGPILASIARSKHLPTEEN